MGLFDKFKKKETTSNHEENKNSLVETPVEEASVVNNINIENIEQNNTISNEGTQTEVGINSNPFVESENTNNIQEPVVNENNVPEQPSFDNVFNATPGDLAMPENTIERGEQTTTEAQDISVENISEKSENDENTEINTPVIHENTVDEIPEVQTAAVIDNPASAINQQEEFNVNANDLFEDAENKEKEITQAVSSTIIESEDSNLEENTESTESEQTTEEATINEENNVDSPATQEENVESNEVEEEKNESTEPEQATEEATIPSDKINETNISSTVEETTELTETPEVLDIKEVEQFIPEEIVQSQQEQLELNSEPVTTSEENMEPILEIVAGPTEEVLIKQDIPDESNTIEQVEEIANLPVNYNGENEQSEENKNLESIENIDILPLETPFIPPEISLTNESENVESNEETTNNEEQVSKDTSSNSISYDNSLEESNLETDSHEINNEENNPDEESEKNNQDSNDIEPESSQEENQNQSEERKEESISDESQKIEEPNVTDSNNEIENEEDIPFANEDEMPSSNVVEANKEENEEAETINKKEITEIQEENSENDSNDDNLQDNEQVTEEVKPIIEEEKEEILPNFDSNNDTSTNKEDFEEEDFREFVLPTFTVESHNKDEKNPLFPTTIKEVIKNNATYIEDSLPTKFCDNCGTILTDDSSICPSCGEPID